MTRILVITAALLSLSVPAYADNYMTFSGLIVSGADSEIGSTQGITDPVLTTPGAEIQTDAAIGISLAAGIRFESPFRAEIEYAYRSLDMDQAVAGNSVTDLEGDFTVNSWLVNLVYDMETYSELTPYLGFGVGLAFHDGSLTKINKSSSNLSDGEDTTFAYQILLGAYYTFMEGMEAGIGYRYFATSDPDYGFLKAGVDTHNFELSLRYNF